MTVIGYSMSEGMCGILIKKPTGRNEAIPFSHKKANTVAVEIIPIYLDF